MNRKLRVDFSNDGAEDETSAPAGYTHPPLPINGIPVPPPNVQNGSSSTLPPLPQGADLPAGLTCPDAISRTLNTLPPSQLLDVLSQMKSLVTTDQNKAIELLRQAPQLSYAIFQALLLMGLVSTDALTAVVEQSAAPTSAPPPTQAQYGVPPPPIPGQGFPPQGFPPVPPQGQIATPPTHGMPYPPPPQQQQYQAPPPQAAAQDTDALIQQVMAMPQELIDQLPPAERAQLLALRAQLMPR
jgi:cleavage stimulation factor subunit 2